LFFIKVLIAFVKTYKAFGDYMPVFAKNIFSFAIISYHIVVLTLNHSIMDIHINFYRKIQTRQNAQVLGKNGNVIKVFNPHFCT